MKPVTRNIRYLLAICLSFACILVQAKTSDTVLPKQQSMRQLADQLHVGDVVFIRVTPVPFEKVAAATGSWTNHVGVVVDVSGVEPVIAESTFPRSRTTTLTNFVARSENGRVAVTRLRQPLSAQQRQEVWHASQRRLGVWYDTGFDLHSKRQFCSRFVREVLNEATGIQVGKVETFRELLSSNPQADLAFWRLWYFGSIPWERQTVTPASMLQSAHLHLVFDGFAST